MNVTAAEPTAQGFITVYPADPVPDASNVNWTGPNQVVPNLVIARLNSSGEASFVALPRNTDPPSTVHVIIDVFGYFSAT
jgi:hypothetical protein